ncbi:hypothetical protein ACN2XU_06895 [Primorskyibacter sp. 2E107]
MKAITIIQAMALALLAVYGASAGADQKTPCTGDAVATHSCEL